MGIFIGYMNARRRKSKFSGLVETAAGDALSSFCFVTVGTLYDTITTQHGVVSWLIISTTLYSIIDLMFKNSCSNPASTLSSYAAGKGGITLLSLVLRSVPQVIGWAAGNVSETAMDHKASGDAGGKLPPDKLAVAQVVSSFLNCFIHLCIEKIEAGPSSQLLLDWTYTFMLMLAFEVTDADKKGISLNPASVSCIPHP